MNYYAVSSGDLFRCVYASDYLMAAVEAVHAIPNTERKEFHWRII